jgi:Fur family transcriptional regulator, stress-responsive regulator
MRPPDELAAVFRAQGRKITAQRQCIFRALHGNESHPTAESIYVAARAEMGTISLKTVYQTLHELAAMGEIAALDLGTGTTRFDPNVEGVHHHLVCRRCGRVRDLHADFSGITVPAGAEEGFDVGQAEVVFRGLCRRCRRGRRSTDRGRQGPGSASRTAKRQQPPANASNASRADASRAHANRANASR